jgi:FdhD protein
MKPINLPQPAVSFACFTHEGAQFESRTRVLPEEVPIALVYDGSTEAVMMATPADLDDFAVGFTFTEGLISEIGQFADLAVAYSEIGIELRMWLAKAPGAAYRQRRRRLAGPTGCGMCGIESLAEAQRPLSPVQSMTTFASRDIVETADRLFDLQELHRQTHATHAAGFYRPGAAMIVREDVGRHNALDKLAGALVRGAIDREGGVIVISSRVSIEMVQKAAVIGAEILVAVSAPTALAVRAAEMANITLVAVARGKHFEVFTHPRRIQ